MSIAAPLVSAMKNRTRNVIFNEGPESYYPSKAEAKVWLVSKQFIDMSQRDLWSRNSLITAVRTSDLYLVLVILLGNNKIVIIFSMEL